MRYGCIHRRRNQLPIRMMCRALRVSPSGYYAWRVRPESRRTCHDRELTRVIRRLHAQSDCTSNWWHKAITAGGPKWRD